jgi:hypothetical protein
MARSIEERIPGTLRHRCSLSLLDSLHPPHHRFIDLVGTTRELEFIAKLRQEASLSSLAAVLWHCFLIAEKSAICLKSSVVVVNCPAVDTGQEPQPGSALGQIESTAWRSLSGF